jgi:hypothetical protein
MTTTAPGFASAIIGGASKMADTNRSTPQHATSRHATPRHGTAGFVSAIIDGAPKGADTKSAD